MSHLWMAQPVRKNHLVKGRRVSVERREDSSSLWHRSHLHILAGLRRTDRQTDRVKSDTKILLNCRLLAVLLLKGDAKRRTPRKQHQTVRCESPRKTGDTAQTAEHRLSWSRPETGRRVFRRHTMETEREREASVHSSPAEEPVRMPD